jgi:hypothetical protein
LIQKDGIGWLPRRVGNLNGPQNGRGTLPRPARVKPRPWPLPYSAVNKALAEANAAYRAAEPDPDLDLGPEAERVLKTYQELQSNFHGFWVLVQGERMQPDLLQKAFDSIEGSCAKLRAETHLALPKTGHRGLAGAAASDAAILSGPVDNEVRP